MDNVSEIFLEHIEDTDADEAQKAKQQLEQIDENDLYDNEIPLVETLKLQSMKLPKIDMSFLQMGREVKFKVATFMLPRFGVFAYSHGSRRRFRPLFLYMLGEKRFVFSAPGSVLGEHLAMAMGFQTTWRGNGADAFEFSCQHHKDCKHFWKALGNDEMMLVTELSTLIPQRAKKKVEDLVDCHYFSMSAYLIAEIPVGNWAIRRSPKNDPNPVSDPLLIGVHRDQTYLLDWFGCTEAEEYVRREFSE